MIRKKDWKYQTAIIGKEYWINKVGTYGVASAQLYWGRLAALVLRILYALFPMVEWFFVFVDDIIAIYRQYYDKKLALAIMASLYAIGIPMAWHKTVLTPDNLWVGFSILTNQDEFLVSL